MKILFINNDGGGFADTLDVREGITLRGFFDALMPGCAPKNYLIRVNRQPATHHQVLQEQDRVSVTPTKIHGACLAA